MSPPFGTPSTVAAPINVQGVRKRGAIPRRWWWEQKMSLDALDAIE
jgi:hypothetical protein